MKNMGRTIKLFEDQEDKLEQRSSSSPEILNPRPPGRSAYPVLRAIDKVKGREVRLPRAFEQLDGYVCTQNLF